MGMCLTTLTLNVCIRRELVVVVFDLWTDVHGPNYSVTCVPYADGSQGLHAKSSFTIKLQIRIFLSRTTIAKTKRFWIIFDYSN